MSSILNKSKNKKYKKSIVSQIVFSFIAIMGVILILCWIANNLFLERYYMYSKKKTIETAYDNLNDIVNKYELGTEEIDLILEPLCEKDSLNILLFDPDKQLESYTGKDSSDLRRVLWDHLFGHPGSPLDKSDDISMQIKGEKKEIIKSTDEYEMCISINAINGSEYIDLWGNLENDTLFIIRTPIESIQSSVHIANRFIGYIGMVELFVSLLMIIVVSRKFTKPILELAEISGKMANLEFDAKYTSGGNNEIAYLGDNINKLSESLEKNIAELKSANIELQKDIEKKTQIDEMRTEFLSNVSHELKTPIALIQGYAEGLQEGITDDPDSMSYYCEVICDEADKMNTMVKKLLTLNQLEFGNDVAVMERFDISGLIRNCVTTTDILAKRNDINIIIPNESSVYVWGDEFKVEEVLINYLSNAINHCDNEKKIEISLEDRDAKVRVTVFNTGMPIPEENIKHIWEKFYKVDKARTRAYGGSGIGLSIVAAICKSMNQNYGVENCENGVSFWFELDRK